MKFLTQSLILLLLDNLINKLLKDSREGGNSYVISKLLKVNAEIKKRRRKDEKYNESCVCMCETDCW